MAVFKIEKHKRIKDENGNIIQVNKTPDEYNKETRNGTHIWYFKAYKKNINGINKSYKSKKFKTKSEAQEAERIFLMKRDNPTTKPFVLVAKAYFNYLYTVKKESTVYSYENVYNKQIKPYFENYNVNDISILVVKQWCEELQKKGLKINYLNKIYNVLKNIINYGMKDSGVAWTNPLDIIGRFQEKKEDVISDEEKLRYITLEQFQKLISVIDDITWKTFFTMLFYTGMRKGEVQALTWRDIDFQNKTINVIKTLSKSYITKQKINTNETIKEVSVKITSTKNNQNRKIKMNKTLTEQLMLYKQEMKKFSDFKESWFVFGCSRFLASTSIDNNKTKYFKLADIPEITIHEFRHSHVSLLINEYIKSGQTDTTKFFVMMSSRMGHSIEVMQETYMHLFPTIQNEIVDILDNL